jgi:alkanesulfonate monooxygenase SsuD/methylene tetrahydromethanopterin reductase-like flavin-dependent oxidoreductase (luciferase family)
MQFGWLTLQMSPSPEQDGQRIGEMIEQVVACEKLGFSDVWLTEHYFTGESVYNDSLMFAAALAMKTERIRLGFAVVQTPFHHPVQLAVQLALLDNLSNGRIDVGIGKGTVYNEYEFVGYGLRSTDSRERMEEAVEILERAWTESPLTFEGKFHKLHIPAIRPKPVQQPGPPLWRSVISPGSFTECGKLGLPILTARLPVNRIKERWQIYADAIDAGGHAAEKKKRLLEQSALWRNVYVADSQAQAEDELAKLLYDARDHLIHMRQQYNPPDFEIEPSALNAWNDPRVSTDAAVKEALALGSLYGTPARVREQVAELRDVGVRHLLCQTAFGAMDHAQNLASMRRLGEQVMPAFRK